MSFKTWSEISNEGESPYSPTGPTGFSRSQEASDLLTKVGDPKEKLSEVDAEKARKKYLSQSNREIGEINAAMKSSDLGIGKPGEAGTDEEGVSDMDIDDENHEGFQIVRPANPDEVEKRLDVRQIKGDKESIDPLWTEEEKDHWVASPEPLTKADLSQHLDTDISPLPKEDSTTIDNGPKYNTKTQPDTISTTRADIIGKASERKIWQEPLEPKLMEEPGYPEKIKEAEEKKKKGWWRW